MTRSICEMLRAPDFWTAGFHRNGSLSEQEEAAPFEAATLIETQAALLEEVEGVLGRLVERTAFVSAAGGVNVSTSGVDVFMSFEQIKQQAATLAKLKERETHNEA